MSSHAGPPPPPPVVGRALLVSNDSAVVGQLTNAMQQFAITADVCPDIARAASLVHTRKFEAIVLDLALGEEVAYVFERVRLSPSNQNSVTFALVDSGVNAESRVQSNFTMQKPLTDSLVGTTLKVALGLIIRDYRRYFRCSVVVPVLIRIDERVQIPCEMMNISEGGLAVNTPAIFKVGTTVKAQFTLPDEASAFEVDAEICWCDNKGRAGLHFRSVSPRRKQLVQSWLSRRIEQGLPEPAARLFKKSE
jgi:PilZ domain